MQIFLSKKSEKVSKLDELSRLTQKFVDDQVHLTYINSLLYNANTFFTAEIVNLEEGTSSKPEGRTSWKEEC